MAPDRFNRPLPALCGPWPAPDGRAAVGRKGKAVREAIRAVGARLLFLPPYSPDLNPIEQVFAKLKHLMRKAAERTVETTWKRTGLLLDHFNPDECQRYLVNAGYVSCSAQGWQFYRSMHRRFLPLVRSGKPGYVTCNRR